MALADWRVKSGEALGGVCAWSQRACFDLIYTDMLIYFIIYLMAFSVPGSGTIVLLIYYN